MTGSVNNGPKITSGNLGDNKLPPVKCAGQMLAPHKSVKVELQSSGKGFLPEVDSHKVSHQLFQAIPVTSSATSSSKLSFPPITNMSRIDGSEENCGKTAKKTKPFESSIPLLPPIRTD